MEKAIQSVAVIGAGNVGTHLAENLTENGITILSISARSEDSAASLASQVNADIITDLRKIPEADLVIVCVEDGQIASVLEQLPASLAVAYTSGSVDIHTLPTRENLGVFYPLQTFSKFRKTALFEVPFLIEAGNSVFAQQLFDLAWKLSRKVQFASSEERKHLHVGAVMVNNFTNHLAFLAETHLKQHQLDWELLKPLMKETFEKLGTASPFDAQTGPARRNDLETIREHLSMLDGASREIYSAISQSILTTYHSKK